MKQKISYSLALILITLFMLTSKSAPAQVTNATAKKWVKSREWSNGCKLQLFPEVNADEFYKQYHANPALWTKVFAYLRDTNLDTLSVGKHVIDGDNAYVSVTEGPTKDFEHTAWESHRKYIDLQYVIKGKEKMMVAPLSEATVTKPYNEANDNANYIYDGGNSYIAVPGTFYLFFPVNVHRPNIKTDGADTEKKLVIKIRVAQ